MSGTKIKENAAVQNRIKLLIRFAWLLLITAIVSIIFKHIDLFFLEHFTKQYFWLNKILLVIFIIILGLFVIKPFLNLFGVQK